MEELDLDNSVFMNFVRYTETSIKNCFEFDFKKSIIDTIVNDNEDAKKVAEVFFNNYVDFCRFFHEVSANLLYFPQISLHDIPTILDKKLGGYSDQ